MNTSDESDYLSSLVITCQYCNRGIGYNQIKEHVEEHVKNKDTMSGEVAPLNGVEIEDPDLIQTIKHLVIDESGMLVNPDLMQDTKPHESIFARSSSLARGSRGKSKKSSDRAIAQQPAKPPMGPGLPPRADQKNKRQAKSIDDIYREKEEWLKKIFQRDKISSAREMANNLSQTDSITCPVCKAWVKAKNLEKHLVKIHSNVIPLNERTYRQVEGRFESAQDEDFSNQPNLVKCPLCKHRTQYNVLFVHIQVSHPEKNPKIAMAEFNREYEKKKSEDKIDRELNGLVKDYEKLKQSQDESRDGGKYLGYMSRENGKFGSLPLYDDYSDESDSE